MQPIALAHKTKKLLWLSLGFMLIARLLCNAVVPLTDTTEARYGEIARLMLETGDWITPQHDYGAPFWAKPPLSTWLSASSMQVFGVNEFAARLPSLLLGIGMLALIWQWSAQRRGHDFALATCTVLASMSLFFMASGAVMTDSSLAFCTTLTMIAFWRALKSASEGGSHSKWWGYLFFVGLGIGLLAKGPLVGVLTFMPILPWIVLQKNWLRVWRALPWLSGSVLMLVIGLPWYLIAEHKTPGFLEYFILGEHFGRFLNAGWKGDKYGNAHAEPLGTIWVYWLLAALPWSFVALTKVKALAHAGRAWLAEDDGLLTYLALWAFLPMVFFTFSSNIIWTYALPSLPAFAILVVELLNRLRRTPTLLSPPLAALHFVTPVLLLMHATLYYFDHYDLVKPSQKDPAQWYLRVRPNADSELFTYRRRYYSAKFYSFGKAKMIEPQALSTLFDNDTTDFLIIQSDDLQRIAPELRARLRPLQTFGEFELLEEVAPQNVAP